MLVSLAVTLPVAAQTPTSTRFGEEVRDFREKVQETRETFKGEVQQRLEDFRTFNEKTRTDFRAMVEQKRATAQQQLEAKRAELKTRLQTVRDEKKKEIVERIYDKLNDINKNRTDHFSAVVDKIEKVLERVVSRTDKASDRGLDVAGVRTAVEAAKTAIAAARAAIEAQAGKTYSISVTTEQKLKEAAEAARKALHDDLNKVKEAVKAAHEAVRKAAVALAQIPRVDEDAATTTPGN